MGGGPLWKTVKAVTKRQRRTPRWLDVQDSADSACGHGVLRAWNGDCTMTTALRIVHTNIHGAPVGQVHRWTEHSDAVVDRARSMRRVRMSYRAFGTAIGVHIGFVWSRCSGHRRKPAARVLFGGFCPNNSHRIVNCAVAIMTQRPQLLGCSAKRS